MQRIFGLSILAITITGVVLFLFSRTLKSLSDLDAVSGKIIQTELVEINDKRDLKSSVFVIQLNNYEMLFGVQDKYKNEYSLLTQSEVIGKEATIYFDKDGLEVKDDLTLHVYQLEIDNNIILNIERSRWVDKFGLKVMVPLCALIWFSLGYLIIKRK